MNFRACLSVTVLTLAAGCSATASDTTGASSDSDLTMSELPVRLTDFVQDAFDQPIDHADPASATFKQRYWYSTQFADGPDSPVLFYFCGESECTASSVTALADEAKVLHAAVVSLEHRFYGKSLPFQKPTLEQMKHLSIGAALDDGANFEAFAKEKLHLQGKWIAIGGSYPGMLASFYRAKHPDLVVGAWASSAPVDMQETFTGYDQIAARALGPDCTKLFRGALDAATTAFDDDAKRNDLSKRLWGVEYKMPADATDEVKAMRKVRFVDAVTSIAARAAQYGNDHNLCSALAQHADAPIEGVIGFAHPPLVGEASDVGTVKPPVVVGTTTQALGPGDTDPADTTGDATTTTTPNAPVPYAGDMWTYQTCTEVGFFKLPNANREESIFSDLVTVEVREAQCKALTGQLPAIEATRATYFDPIKNGQVTNLFFANGSLDPWSALSFTDPATAPAGVTTFVVQLASHCTDLQSLYPSSALGVFEAHKKFFELATTWLAQ